MLKLTSALIIALLILTVFILPAEYGKDPTGLGASLGILNMSVDKDDQTHSHGTISASYHRCLLYTSPSPRDKRQSRMPSSA